MIEIKFWKSKIHTKCMRNKLKVSRGNCKKRKKKVKRLVDNYRKKLIVTITRIKINSRKLKKDRSNVACTKKELKGWKVYYKKKNNQIRKFLRSTKETLNKNRK